MPTQVRKRTGDLVAFDPDKITAAIRKAMAALDLHDDATTARLSTHVTGTLADAGPVVDIEYIQDRVEDVLETYDERLYKAYSLYRRSRGLAREIKSYFHIHDDLKLGVNALKVLEERYLRRDEHGHITETPTQLFRRVAKAIASVEDRYGGNVQETEDAFYRGVVAVARELCDHCGGNGQNLHLETGQESADDLLGWGVLAPLLAR